jgi:hypothetical protein
MIQVDAETLVKIFCKVLLASIPDETASSKFVFGTTILNLRRMLAYTYTQCRADSTSTYFLLSLLNIFN